MMHLADITVADLATYERPDPDTIGDYWAFTRHYLDTGPAFDLPSRWLRNVPGLGQGALRVWVDPEQRWLWVWIPTDGWSWKTFEEIRSSRPRSDAQAIPQWVREAESNVPSSKEYPSRRNVVARRRLASTELAGVLDEVMPPVDDYPIARSAAHILRAGGWTPESVARLWWAVENDTDAEALAAHPPGWWTAQGWKLSVDTRGLLAPLPARKLRELADADVRPDLVTVCLERGIGDVARIRALRPPVIPDAATRIAFRARGVVEDAKYVVDPASARSIFDRYPELWLDEVTTATDVTLLHAVKNGGLAYLSVWSDGLLTLGRIEPPAAVPDGRFRAFDTTQHLLHTIIHAANRGDLTPQVWMPWQDATAATQTTEQTHTTTRALATDTSVERTLTLTHHTIACADGTHRHLWQVTDTITVTTELLGSSPRGRSRRHHLYTTRADALSALEALNNHPPLCTVAETAAILGTTREALAQALSRETRSAALKAGQPRAPRRVFTTGRTSWYDPRQAAAWWRSRPGHGPGRGHTAQNTPDGAA